MGLSTSSSPTSRSFGDVVFPVPEGGPESLHERHIGPGCNTTYVTPLCLRTIYGTIDNVPKVPGKNRVALNNYDGQASNRSDVALFLSQHRPDAVPAAQTFTIDVLNGRCGSAITLQRRSGRSRSNIESNLDAEILLSFGHPTPLIASNTGSEPSYQEDASEGPNGVNEVSISCIRHGVSRF